MAFAYRRTAASIVCLFLIAPSARSADIGDQRLLDAGSNRDEWLMNGRSYDF